MFETAEWVLHLLGPGVRPESKSDEFSVTTPLVVEIIVARGIRLFFGDSNPRLSVGCTGVSTLGH